MTACVIVDDCPSFLRIARTLLERDGFTVAGVATTSAEAIAQVAALRPDVVLVDVFLGDESGVELAWTLDELGGGAMTVVLVSSLARTDGANLIEANPTHRYLPKIDLTAAALRSLVEGER